MSIEPLSENNDQAILDALLSLSPDAHAVVDDQSLQVKFPNGNIFTLADVQAAVFGDGGKTLERVIASGVDCWWLEDDQKSAEPDDVSQFVQERQAAAANHADAILQQLHGSLDLPQAVLQQETIVTLGSFGRAVRSLSGNKPSSLSARADGTVALLQDDRELSGDLLSELYAEARMSGANPEVIRALRDHLKKNITAIQSILPGVPALEISVGQ